MSIKVLLDTDIGSDIDDAVCLAYLLAQPECELLGITTMSGEAEKRAMLASVLCKVAGKDIPIYPGVEQPLLVAQRQHVAQQATALHKWAHEKTFPKHRAVDFLRKTIHAHPGEITLLTIGPLTNIALLFRTDPEIPFLLKAVVMMCGVFKTRLSGYSLTEWNALLDPHATAILYGTPLKSHRSVGLDVTTQVILSTEEVLERFNHPLLAPVLDMAEVWFKRRNTIAFHDPLAAATLFDEQICSFRRGTVEVELISERLQGLTYWTPASADPKHEVAVEVDSARFFDHYFGVFK